MPASTSSIPTAWCLNQHNTDWSLSIGSGQSGAPPECAAHSSPAPILRGCVGELRSGRRLNRLRRLVAAIIARWIGSHSSTLVFYLCQLRVRQVGGTPPFCMYEMASWHLEAVWAGLARLQALCQAAIAALYCRKQGETGDTICACCSTDAGVKQSLGLEVQPQCRLEEGGVDGRDDHAPPD